MIGRKNLTLVKIKEHAKIMLIFLVKIILNKIKFYKI